MDWLGRVYRRYDYYGCYPAVYRRPYFLTRAKVSPSRNGNAYYFAVGDNRCRRRNDVQGLYPDGTNPELWSFDRHYRNGFPFRSTSFADGSLQWYYSARSSFSLDFQDAAAIPFCSFPWNSKALGKINMGFVDYARRCFVPDCSFRPACE